MRRRVLIHAALLILLLEGLALAKVDLVILPKRETAQLTIYNSADLTLVREQRALTLKKGLNRLQFSWANTLIDPTSLDMTAQKDGARTDILDLTFPPRAGNLGLWHIQSPEGGRVPVEITYLTSGLSWRAFYAGTLSPDEKSMDLKGYVRVSNNSGEDYEEARVRMIVGKISLIDRIADLARRPYPHGRPGPEEVELKAEDRAAGPAALKQKLLRVESAMAARPKEIEKEGLSEYFLYTIEGTETIPHGWSRRLPSFSAPEVPVVNLYKYEEERYGKQVMRFLSFRNDRAHNLGATPVPGGVMKVFRSAGGEDRLSYEGESRFKYIPVDQEVELSLGPVSNVIVEATLMDYRTDNFMFDQEGDISGWDEIREFEVEVRNTREIPVRTEIRRHIDSSSWELEKSGDYGSYEKLDLNRVKFTIALGARETRKFRYTLTTHQGLRAR